MHFCAPGRIFETRTKFQKNTPKPQKLIRFLKNYSENTKKNFKNKCSFLSVSLPENHVSSDFLLPKDMCMFFQHSETEFGHFNTQFGSDLHEFQKKWKLNIFQFFGQYSARLEYLEKKADLVDLSF